MDEETKRRMARLRDIKWSEVLRMAIRRRLELEERRRASVDRWEAMEAARRMDEFRSRIGPSDFDSTRTIRKGREPPPRS